MAQCHGNDPERIIIVGGVSGGAGAAALFRRFSEQAEIIVFERGPHVSFADWLVSNLENGYDCPPRMN